MRYIPLLFILTIAFCAGLTVLNLVKNFEKRRFNLISLVYLTFLAVILFTPISFDGSSVYVMPAGIGQVNLHQLDVLELGFAENIILTVPLGFLIKYYLPKVSIISMALAGFLIGSLIETTQFFLSHIFLINRMSDINDVIANALGIVVGAILMIAYEMITEKTSSKRSHS